ncbi:CocE/NonD family hydrolase [Terriglobus sp. RCC_193]|uniref:CocE/NonD family hydrolase n=1 Tax=Terriglobus sp. RCC_193 TaxID=3239218 RepID=UPI0035248CE7
MQQQPKSATSALQATAVIGVTDSASEETRPSAYPTEWNVAFGPTAPLQIAPPAPFGVEDDGNYRFPLWTERYTGFNPQEVVYPAGLVTHIGAPALKVAIRKLQDVPIKLRDGVTIYADILRAADAPADMKLPTIIAWSPYGKTTPKNHAFQHWIAQLPVDRVSGLAVTEGPDPNFWVPNGYNVVHIDPRGVNSSEGHVHWWGSVNAHDGYDVVEWIAEQSWSSGKVGMSGVSWLGLSQYYVASTNPPHLAAIAPRAHTADIYRQFYVMTGGIPSVTPFFKELIDGIMGDGSLTERFDAMAVEQPLMNAYWEDKRAKVEHIHGPAVYAVAGYGGFGSTSDAILGIPDGKKWLRYARNYHLADYYSEAALAQEKAFFDHYLKGADNGWERDTPKVVVEVLEPGVETGVALTLIGNEWPLQDTEYRKLYLDAATNSINTTVPTEVSVAPYDAMTGKRVFMHTFEQDTTVAGFMKGKFWVQTNGANDMDLFVRVEKVKGDAVIPLTINNARLRVSLRELDPALSTDFRPVQSFRKSQLLAPDEVVAVEVWLQSHAMMFRSGEQLRLTIGGRALAETSFGTASGLRTTGVHTIHAGSEHNSYLQIPIPSADAR